MSGLSIPTLRKSARRSTAGRGHSMRWHAPVEQEFAGEKLGRFTQYGACSKCGMEVTLRTHPAPNQIDIGGEAVALDCK